MRNRVLQFVNNCDQWAYPLQGVLVDLAILDNHAQVLELANDLDVLQRIAIDQQQISQRTFLSRRPGHRDRRCECR